MGLSLADVHQKIGHPSLLDQITGHPPHRASAVTDPTCSRLLIEIKETFNMEIMSHGKKNCWHHWPSHGAKHEHSSVMTNCNCSFDAESEVDT